jgi:hypothetical protein
MPQQLKIKKGVTKAELLEAVRIGTHDALWFDAVGQIKLSLRSVPKGSKFGNSENGDPVASGGSSSQLATGASA